MKIARASLALLVTIPFARGAAQLAPAAPVRYESGWGDVASVAAAAGLFVLPGALGLPDGPPSCAPCDPATLPAIDRWAVHPLNSTASTASTVLLFGVGAWAAVAGLNGLPADQWHGNLAVFANTASWTAASAEWIKVLVRRKRPILYTSDAVSAASDRDNQKSLPSTHTALAFAAATSYLVMAERQHLAHRKTNTLVLYAGALGVGALRIVAAKHFPTDVATGAALGSFVGWLVPTIHPTH
jgi:membrane-associated phospholipid phosphatase